MSHEESHDDKPGLGLFEGFGIELEYMIVDAETFDVRPIADRALVEDGAIVSELERGAIAWSNELVSHVIELKTNGPAPTLDGLDALFQQSLVDLSAILEPHGARLLPTAMHPWMRPLEDTVLWPHDYSDVYEAFDRIFGCKGHGWSNLQSMHVNLPYRGDDELRRLHDAIRVVLPLLPALAASSPFVEGAATDLLDNRLEHYRHNCRRLPAVTGHVVPEQVNGEADYRRKVLGAIAEAIAPHDPDGILDPEWVNARGAIVRFVRDSIEIRVIDVQEHPAADLAIAGLVVATLRALIDGRFDDPGELASLPETTLERILLSAIRDADEAVVDEPALLRCFGLPERAHSMADIWRHLAAETLDDARRSTPALATILDRGPLARRMRRAVGDEPGALRALARELADCLHAGRPFLP